VEQIKTDGRINQRISIPQTIQLLCLKKLLTIISGSEVSLKSIPNIIANAQFVLCGKNFNEVLMVERLAARNANEAMVVSTESTFGWRFGVLSQAASFVLVHLTRIWLQLP
jgi:hypothetical protein